MRNRDSLVKYRTRGGIAYILRSFDRNITGEIKCALFDSGDCDFSCKFPSQMDVHNATHSEDRPFTCDLCPAKYKQKVALTFHRKRHDEDDPNGGKSGTKNRDSPLSNKCSHWDNGCSWSFVSPSLKQRHERVHSDEALYECSECDFKCKHESSLQRHIHYLHSTPERISCPLWDRSLSPYSLYAHLKRHEIYDSFNCKSCDYETHVKEQWLNHLTSKEHRDNYIPSKLRPSSIVNKEDYKSEIDLEYSNNPLFIKCSNDKCPVCTRVMENVSKLSYGGYFVDIAPGITCQSSNVLYMWVNKRTGKPIFRKHRYVGITSMTLFKRISFYRPGMKRNGKYITELFDKYGKDLGLIPILMTDDADPVGALDEAEINFIACFNCRKTIDGGCNVQPGGRIEHMPAWLRNWLEVKGLLEN